MTFTITRSKWLRGEGDKASRLLRAHDGKMCCVGQMCLQLGVTEAEIREKTTVVTLSELPDSVDAAVSRAFGRWTYEAYEMNDNVCYSDDEREAELMKIAKRGDHELVFID